LGGEKELNVGLHASYYPMPQEQLDRLIATIQTPAGNREISLFRELNSDKEFYVGTTWHALDVMLNPPGHEIPALVYAVRGHAFPAPDGSVDAEPHMASYDDEYWQLFSYVTAAEAKEIARVLAGFTIADLETRWRPDLFESLGVYHRPADTDEEKRDYVEFLTGLRSFYETAAAAGNAVLISIG
jgi:hypothetical protein